jgi:hypothetical protein
MDASPHGRYMRRDQTGAAIHGLPVDRIIIHPSIADVRVLVYTMGKWQDSQAIRLSFTCEPPGNLGSHDMQTFERGFESLSQFLRG